VKKERGINDMGTGIPEGLSSKWKGNATTDKFLATL